MSGGARERAWNTRRKRYGQSGHAAAYRSGASVVPSIYRAALSLVIRLYRDGTLSEGQCCKALAVDRVTFRGIVDDEVHA